MGLWFFQISKEPLSQEHSWFGDLEAGGHEVVAP